MSTNSLDAKVIRPFLFSVLLWFLLCILISPKIGWSLVLGVLGVLDIYATARALAPFFSNQTVEENHRATVFQAFYWGTIKLVSLTLLGALVLKFKSMPILALLAGVSVFLIIPLIGGVFWFYTNTNKED